MEAVVREARPGLRATYPTAIQIAMGAGGGYVWAEPEGLRPVVRHVRNWAIWVTVPEPDCPTGSHLYMAMASVEVRFFYPATAPTSTPSTTTPAAAATSTPALSVASCSTDQIRGSVLSAGPASGTINIIFAFENISNTPCTLYGLPRVTIHTTDGQTIQTGSDGFALHAASKIGPTTPRRSSTIGLQGTDHPADGPGTAGCPAARLTLPASFTVTWDNGSLTISMPQGTGVLPACGYQSSRFALLATTGLDSS